MSTGRDKDPRESSSDHGHITLETSNQGPTPKVFVGGSELSLCPTNSTADSYESAALPGIFASTENDTLLNLNPSISSAPAGARSFITVSQNDVFSRAPSYATNPSLFGSSAKTPSKDISRSGFGQTLQTLNILEHPETEATSSNQSRMGGSAPPPRPIEKRVHELHQDLELIMSQFNSSLIHLTKAVINSIDCLKAFVAEGPGDTRVNCTNPHMRGIMKWYLRVYDNLLADDVYMQLKLMVVKNFNEFVQLVDPSVRVSGGGLMVKPRNYPLASKCLPQQRRLQRIIDRIAGTLMAIKEQNGAFIAPISRGIAPSFKVLCLYFGYPLPTDHHYKMAKALTDLYDDIHVMVVKNCIEAALLANPVPQTAAPDADRSPSSAMERMLLAPEKPSFKLPFRNPTDPAVLPMGMSLSTEGSVRTLGTVGGFIYPKIDLKKQANLALYANAKFAISCGHVCLEPGDEAADTPDYAHVSLPLLVLISMYKNALMNQYSKATQTGNREAVVAYSNAVHHLDLLFPIMRVKGRPNVAPRNLPKQRFGQIIWGERTLIEATPSSKRLSDVAIIKVNKKLQCNQNYLGDDIVFNEYDPGLMFDNLYVRAVVHLARPDGDLALQVDSVDVEVPLTHEGLSVFKYGSTTRYTRGNLNGIKLVYWLDGAIHSLEFVVNLMETSSAFAAGGDSGAWILTKLEDLDLRKKGLGVVGMIHLYDGEHKQFGLFTPMCEILSRLHDVTNIEWGVVGVPDKATINDDESTDEEYEDHYNDARTLDST